VISPKLIPAILLAIAALRGQSVPVKMTYDGCNWTTCALGGICSTTTAYCGPLPESIRAQLAEQSKPTPAIGTTRNLTFHAGLLVSSICGKDDRNPTASIDLVQVSCIDYDRLKAQAPDFPWPTGRVTQVLVHVREGDAVKITVGGVAKFAELIKDAWGRMIALIQFDGADHTSLDVKVYRAVE